MILKYSLSGRSQRLCFSAWRRPHLRGRLRGVQASSIPKSVTAELIELKAALSEAVAEEDFRRAAELRDKIQELEKDDPESVLREELKRAVNQERYEDAALLKSKLTEVQQQRGSGGSSTGGQTARTQTSSERVTEGIRVTAQSFFVEDASKPEDEQYLFAYHVTIKNESKRSVKLVERYWEVINDRGQCHEMRGEGVVGRQPELAPGQQFVYQATCPLSTPFGEMKGHYEMYVKNETNGKYTSSFLADIGVFALNSQCEP